LILKYLEKPCNYRKKLFRMSSENLFQKNKQVFELIDRSFLGDEQKESFKTIWLEKQKIFQNS
jgi:hypothetical protein